MDISEHFISYFSKTFSDSFFENLTIPKDIITGERVLYKLADNKEAERREITQVEIEQFEIFMEKFCQVSGGRKVEVEMPVTSGLPYARLMDIPGWELACQIPLQQYLASDELIPERECPIEWILGVCFFHSKKMLVHMDFVHPTVAGVFSAEYEIDQDFRLNSKVESWFKEYIQVLNDFRSRANQNTQMYQSCKVVSYEANITVRGLLNEGR